MLPTSMYKLFRSYLSVKGLTNCITKIFTSYYRSVKKSGQIQLHSKQVMLVKIRLG